MKGAAMDKPFKNDYKFMPYAVIGLIVVLGIMYFYPKISKTINLNTTSPKVTVENEFSQPKVSPEANTPEEKPTTQQFSFAVTSPTSGTTVNVDTVTITGKTVPQADIFVNEVDTKADAAGNFSIAYTLEEGENYLIVGANDEFGHSDETELKIFYDK